MRNFFTFNGVSSKDFGVYISGSGRITIPTKAYTFQEIPGRSGDLIVDRKARVANDLITYPAFIGPSNERGVVRSYPEMAGRLRAWLLSVQGYARLTDSYDPKRYRLAAFAGPTEFQSLPSLLAGNFELQFTAKPQRYHDDEEDALALTAGETETVRKCGYVFSEPLFAVSGTGTFTVGAVTVTVAQNSLTGPIYIDCRLMDCYDSAGVNANRFVSFSDYEFPVVADGTVIDAGDVDLEVKPRWFEL